MEKYNSSTKWWEVWREINVEPGQMVSSHLMGTDRTASVRYFLRRWLQVPRNIELTRQVILDYWNDGDIASTHARLTQTDPPPPVYGNPIPEDKLLGNPPRRPLKPGVPDIRDQLKILDEPVTERGQTFPGTLTPAAMTDGDIQRISNRVESLIRPRLTADFQSSTMPVLRTQLTQAFQTAEQRLAAGITARIDETVAAAYDALRAYLRPRITLVDPKGMEYELPDEPRHSVFPELLAALAGGANVFLVGPAGSGKTHLAGQVAKALDLPFEFIGAIGSEYKLSGFIDAQGAYHATSYRRAFQSGGIFLADEFDGSSANAVLYMNAALSNGMQDFPDGSLPAHPDFRFIASANTYGHGATREYVGRNQLDAASLDRFYVLPMDYDVKLELDIAARCRHPSQSPAQVADWLTFVHAAREAVRALNMRHVISTRAITGGLKALAQGIELSAVKRAVLWKNLSTADIDRLTSHEAFRSAQRSRSIEAARVYFMDIEQFVQKTQAVLSAPDDDGLDDLGGLAIDAYDEEGGGVEGRPFKSGD